MSDSVIINISKDFTPTPAGRYSTDGEFSGQRFREEFMLPNLKAGKQVTVQLDGTKGYGSSFLEESFGGLVRAGISREVLKKNLKLVSSDSSLILEIQEYIETAN